MCRNPFVSPESKLPSLVLPISGLQASMHVPPQHIHTQSGSATVLWESRPSRWCARSQSQTHHDLELLLEIAPVFIPTLATWLCKNYSMCGRLVTEREGMDPGKELTG